MSNRIVTITIYCLSVIVPLVIGWLLFSVRIATESTWVYVLPHLNAVLNTTTAILLVTALVLIKKGNKRGHRTAMTIAFTLGAMFFVSYLIYHASVPSQMYGDVDGDGILSPIELDAISGSRGVYLTLLLSHIGLATIVLPLILFSFYYALSGNFEKHKRIVRFSWPIWFYVSVSGVIVYLMISAYY